MDRKGNIIDPDLEVVFAQSPEIKEMMLKLCGVSTDIVSMKADIEVLKKQMNDKVSKVVFGELENKIQTHTKVIDGTSKKMNDIKTNNMTIPISAIDDMKKQIITEISETIGKLMTEYQVNVNRLIDGKFSDVHSQIANSKRAMYNTTRNPMLMHH